MKLRGKLQRLLFVLCIGLLSVTASRTMRLAAAEEGGEENPVEQVKPVRVDFEELWLEVDAGDNTAVYYSDRAKKVWSEALPGADGNYLIDISWIKGTSAAEITLKGDKNEEVVSVQLPARESKYKIKFDKVKGVLTFTYLPDSVTEIQWRKATSYDWQTVSVEDAVDPDSEFAEELDKLRVAGASIYVRTAGSECELEADGTLDAGIRPGKEIKLSITKRGSAPKVKIDGSRLTLNTTNSMEYSTDGGRTWEPAEKKLALSKVAPGALGASAQDVVVWIRKKATSRSPYSKLFVLEVPAQRSAPAGAEVTYESRDGKFWLTFTQASKTSPYEYTVVKAGNTLDISKASWKSVVAAKTISVSEKTAPAGSKIYVRKKTVKQTTTTEFELASATMEISVSY
ncbi:MAG: hypothetical protein K2P87_08635 [Lachnospiraceae bacterium]|nr:hypothetical protein [Lachnospiraceae bacterium]